MVLDQLNLDAPKTKEMVKVLNNLKAERKVLLVLPEKDEVVERAARNLPNVKMLYVNTLNVYDILNYDKFIATKAAVEKIQEVYA